MNQNEVKSEFDILATLDEQEDRSREIEMKNGINNDRQSNESDRITQGSGSYRPSRNPAWAGF